MTFQQTSLTEEGDRPLTEKLSSEILETIVGGNGIGNIPLTLSANVSEVEWAAQTRSDSEYRYVSVRRFF